MKRNERLFIAFILVSIGVMTIGDLLTDTKEGAKLWHILIESFVAIIALLGTFILLKDTFKLKTSLETEIKLNENLKIQANQWKEQSKKYIEGLSHAIDSQLAKWDLTQSEKEIAFMLLKGFSLKEIAQLRGTSEKTVRAQSTAIYAKAGVSGRSELSAFFLEDLLGPTNFT